MFLVNLKSVQRIWKRVKDTPSGLVADVQDRRKFSGRKKISIDRDIIVSIPLNRRKSLRSLGEAMCMSFTTLHRRLKEGELRRHSNAIKPLLGSEHKIARLKFCLSMLDPRSLLHEPKFSGMYKTVHIDEKWFYMTEKTVSYYLQPDEDDPLHSCQSKSFITKVMFITAIARPRFDAEGNEVFSGKIGLFPFVIEQPAIRRSSNREAGTLETKTITVTKETVRAYLLQKIIPAIKAKWPAKELGQTIFIQQDNAKTHIRPENVEFQMAASQDRFDF